LRSTVRAPFFICCGQAASHTVSADGRGGPLTAISGCGVSARRIAVLFHFYNRQVKTSIISASDIPDADLTIAVGGCLIVIICLSRRVFVFAGGSRFSIYVLPGDLLALEAVDNIFLISGTIHIIGFVVSGCRAASHKGYRGAKFRADMSVWVCSISGVLCPKHGLLMIL
jgi:hypothetical protein